MRISPNLSDLIDERCDLDDYSRSDVVRVMLGLKPIKRDPVFKIRQPLEVNGTFSLATPRRWKLPVPILDELTQKFWIPVPPRVTKISKSLRGHLGLLGIKARRDEPHVVVLPGRKGERAANLWLTDAEVLRLDALAENAGMAFVDFLAGAIFGEAKQAEDRVELGEAA